MVITGAFAQGVYEIVARIPAGRVTTYGRVALALGYPGNARRVGWVLRGAVRERGLPCQRVVNHAGYLSGGWAFGHPDLMQALLVEEGVPFKTAYVVDLHACIWNPSEELDDDTLRAIRDGQLSSTSPDEVDDLDQIS